MAKCRYFCLSSVTASLYRYLVEDFRHLSSFSTTRRNFNPDGWWRQVVPRAEVHGPFGRSMHHRGRRRCRMSSGILRNRLSLQHIRARTEIYRGLFYDFSFWLVPAFLKNKSFLGEENVINQLLPSVLNNPVIHARNCVFVDLSNYLDWLENVNYTELHRNLFIQLKIMNALRIQFFINFTFMILVPDWPRTIPKENAGDFIVAIQHIVTP